MTTVLLVLIIVIQSKVITFTRLMVGRGFGTLMDAGAETIISIVKLVAFSSVHLDSINVVVTHFSDLHEHHCWIVNLTSCEYG